LTWDPIGGPITQTQITVNPGEIPGGDQAKVKVIASDDVNNASDESDDYFSVDTKEPIAFIYSPERDGTMPPTGSVYFQGYAFDPEDGSIPETDIYWSSSIDGSLGVGTTILASLSKGQHIIKLSVTDSDGLTATDTINIFVGHKLYLPIATRYP
jgi:hypothetical protein